MYLCLTVLRPFMHLCICANWLILPALKILQPFHIIGIPEAVEQKYLQVLQLRWQAAWIFVFVLDHKFTFSAGCDCEAS